MRILKKRSLIISLYSMVFSFISCSKKNYEFTNEDIEAQQAFTALIDLTQNSIDKNALKDSIKTLKLPTKTRIITSNEENGYVEKSIRLTEEDRRIHMYYDIIELINVRKGECFLPSVDHNFPVKDFFYNIIPCIKNTFPKIKDQLLAKYPETYSIDYPFFAEMNHLLSPYGVEMGIVYLYDDGFHFLFFKKKNKHEIYSVFKRLGIQIGDHNTLFNDYDPEAP